MSNKATPSMFTKYNLAINLLNIYNAESGTTEWLHLNYNQVLTSIRHVLTLTDTTTLQRA
jgi:hypothetical protein